MMMPCELEEPLWAVVGATMMFEVPRTYAKAIRCQELADKSWPNESFVITTAEAAQRAIENEHRQTSETV